MELIPVFSALTGAIVGFGLGQLNRLFDRGTLSRTARREAAEVAIGWAFRISLAPDATWVATVTAWSEAIGPMFARFSSLRTKGSKYVVGYVNRELRALMKARSEGATSEALLERTLAFRDEMSAWVDDSSHAHELAKTLV